MPESHWINVTMQQIEKLLSHPVARKRIDPDIIRALNFEHERLFHTCVAAQEAERA